MKKPIGSWTEMEDELHKHLVELQKKNELAVHRFYDSKSARNMLPAQPADFLIGYRGTGTLWEAKFSEKHESLRSVFSNAVEGHQTASARIWTRAQFRYTFVFYSSIIDRFEIWPGLYCYQCRSQRKRLNRAMCVIATTLDELTQIEFGLCIS